MASRIAPRRGDFGIACRLLALVTLLCVPTQVEALDKFWDGGAAPAGLDGIFSDRANWNTVLAPDSNDVAHFGVSSPPSPFQFVYTVSFSANANTSSLIVEEDFVTFDLNGHTYTNNHSPFIVATQIGNQSGRFGQLTVNNGLLDINSVLFVGVAGGFGTLTFAQGGSVQSDFFARIGASGSSGTVNVSGSSSSEWIHAGELSVGWGGTGTMNITAGGEVQNNKGIIADGGGTGTVTVSGFTSQWFNSLDLVIGNGGNGTLNINSEGVVQNDSGHVSFVAGHTGAVNVDGRLARWFNSGSLFVGDLGSGTMSITGGGEVTSVGAAVGAAAGAAGAVTISGADILGFSSEWINSGDLNVGGGGLGTLDIMAGGRLSTDKGFIGRDAGSMGEVNVDGFRSFWDSGTNLTVGAAGAGVLNITASGGGGVVSDEGVLGRDVGSTGTVTITGDDSVWVSDFLSVGVLGHGTVNVTDGGLLNTVSAVIGVEMGSVGEVKVDGVGSLWTNSGLIFVSSFGPGTGTLAVTNGGTVSAQGGMIVRLLGTLRGNGQIIGNVSNIGVVAPGLSPGALHVTGGFTQGVQGKLDIELAGTTASAEYDQLLVSGAVALGGALKVSLTNGFTPTSGMSFDILDWGSISGTFATLTLPTLGAGLVWNDSQLYLTGALSVGLPGDFNADSAVNAADYVVWRKNPGGIYSPDDYNIWRAHFGQTAGSGASSALPLPPSALESAVPEPAGFVLLSIGVIMGLAVRRRPSAE